MDLSEDYFCELRNTFFRTARHFIRLTFYYNHHGIYFPENDVFFFHLKRIFNMPKSEIDSFGLLYIFSEFKTILRMYKTGAILEEPSNYRFVPHHHHNH